MNFLADAFFRALLDYTRLHINSRAINILEYQEYYGMVEVTYETDYHYASFTYQGDFGELFKELTNE